jgi:hypothetical protein
MWLTYDTCDATNWLRYLHWAFSPKWYAANSSLLSLLICIRRSTSGPLQVFWSYVPLGQLQDCSVRLLRDDTSASVLLQARDQISDTVFAAASAGRRLLSLHYLIERYRVSEQCLQEVLLGELVDEDDIRSVWRFAVV